MSLDRSYHLNWLCRRCETRQIRVSGVGSVVIMVGLLTFWLPQGLVSRASASCGDWLAHPVAAPGTASSQAITTGQVLPGDVLMRHWARSLDQRPADRDRWPGSPCQGGRCERAPVPPMPPVPVRIGGTEHQLADAGALRDVVNNSSSLLFVVEDAGSALPGFPYRIRRPPKI